MPQNTDIAVAASAWTMITDADVTSVTFQNKTSGAIYVKATTDTTEPANRDGAIVYNSGAGERNVSMSDLFPGLSGADRLWVWASAKGEVFVSHAA